MSDLKIVILAAGMGKRMSPLGFNIPKHLIPIHGRPMISYLIKAIKEAAVDSEPIIITAPDTREQFCEKLGATICRWVIQEAQLGTGHAVICALNELGSARHVLVLYGDHPLLTPQTIRRLVEVHRESGATLTLATVKFSDFEDWRQWFYNFGRIIRDENGQITRIVEFKDATEEEKAVTEVNPAYFIFRRDWLCENLRALSNDNVQQEYYLTDLIARAGQQGEPIHSLVIENAIEAIGVNTPEQLQAAEEALCE